MTLEILFERCTGALPVKKEALTGSASHRRYYRLTGADGRTLIGVEGTDPDENRAFITLARHFASKGIRVPKVLAEEGLLYLQEDLGSLSLYEALSSGRSSGSYSADETVLLRKTLSALPKIQVEGAQGLDWSVCYPQESFDARMVDFDLNYFKYNFLKLAGLEFNEIRLQDDFDRLRSALLEEPSDTFLYRDFNARNVMICEGEPCFIDFQGGRRGPVYYDIASFLWQARARYPEALREDLLQTYLQALRAYGPVNESHFRERLRLFVLFRLLQVLGCYGFRGLWEGHRAFADSIPPALALLRGLLPLADYPYLSDVLSRVAANPDSLPQVSAGTGGVEVSGNMSTPGHGQGEGPVGYKFPLCGDAVDNGRGRSEQSERSFPDTSTPEEKVLTVTIYSFSYKKGIPEDKSGNGGGYVFDCRGTHNPGKYAQYQSLTGLDEPVIRFLEEDGEILRFLDQAYALVDAHVERFLQRCFTHLQVSFGCTGGQHRSVYSAEHLAAHLVERYPVCVHLIHRERGIDRYLRGVTRKAMVFAAGLGTRLKPLTDTMPKALVPVCGQPLLHHVLKKLTAAGYRDIVVNVHHFPEQIRNYLATNDFGARIRISDESGLLRETGGAIRYAAPLLLDNGDCGGSTFSNLCHPRQHKREGPTREGLPLGSSPSTGRGSEATVTEGTPSAVPEAKEPFLVHNVDIISDLDLGWLRNQHRKDALATLLVSDRKTQRYFLFDDDMRLRGWTNVATGEVRSPYGTIDPDKYRKLAFAGIHLISPEVFQLFEDLGLGERFSIVDFYLQVCADHPVYGVVPEKLRIVDVGKMETLPEAERVAEAILQGM